MDGDSPPPHINLTLAHALILFMCQCRRFFKNILRKGHATLVCNHGCMNMLNFWRGKYFTG